MPLNQYSKTDYALKSSNTFQVEANCSHIFSPSTVAELETLPELNTDNTGSNFYILGEGSNTLFIEAQAPIIIQPQFKGIHIDEYEGRFVVTVGAAENWHELVCFCLKKGIYGLENLALIPGSVGAAPVQNIGAYGVEFADFCQEVQWFEFASKKLHTLSNQACHFSYRDSTFKQERYNKGVITQVVFTFSKKWQANLRYSGLDILPQNSSAEQVMEQVIALRSSKLPDPKILPNAGSFFKNPVIEQKAFTQLQQQYPTIPHYPQTNGKIKLAAGWLIEQTGLKGFRYGAVGVHQHQALVLVNYGSEVGEDIITLAKYVQRKVLEKFSVLLTPEVRLVTQTGEKSFASLKDNNPINDALDASSNHHG